MDIAQALPQKKYLAALTHSQDPEWKKLRDSTIANIKNWLKTPGINQKYLPAVNFGYGKDGMAVLILLKMAGIDFTALTVINGGDLPVHELVFPEFDRFLGHSNKIFYRTEKRYVEYLAYLRDWGRKNGMTKKNGELVDYCELGESLTNLLYWYTADRFSGVYGDGADNIPFFTGKRGAEAMDRFFKFKDKGAFIHQQLQNGQDKYNYWDANPLAFWKDGDVWALLVSEKCPVSVIYSYHQIPQKGGKQAFPRTYWYPEPILMNSQYFKWLAYYAPVQVKELVDLFPEIKQRFSSSQKTGE